MRGEVRKKTLQKEIDNRRIVMTLHMKLSSASDKTINNVHNKAVINNLTLWFYKSQVQIKTDRRSKDNIINFSRYCK